MRLEGEASEASIEGEAAAEAQFEGYPEDARSDAAGGRGSGRSCWRVSGRPSRAARRGPLSRAARSSPPPPPSGRSSTAIRSLDLDTKVELDSLRRALNEANRLAYRNAWAAEASVAATGSWTPSTLAWPRTTGPRPSSPRCTYATARTGKPRRAGLEGVLFDPRFAGGLALAGIWAIGHFRGQSQGVADIRFANPSPITSGSVGAFSAIPVDSRGRTITATISWASDTSNVLEVNQTTGQYTAGNPGTATITVTPENSAASRSWSASLPPLIWPLRPLRPLPLHLLRLLRLLRPLRPLPLHLRPLLRPLPLHLLRPLLRPLSLLRPLAARSSCWARRGSCAVGVAAGRGGNRRRPGARGGHPAGQAGDRDPGRADGLPLRHGSDLPDPGTGRRSRSGRATTSSASRRRAGSAPDSSRPARGRLRRSDDAPRALDPGPADVRRGPGLALTGTGVVVAAVDWGVDVDSAAFRWPRPSGKPAGHRPGRHPVPRRSGTSAT